MILSPVVHEAAAGRNIAEDRARCRPPSPGGTFTGMDDGITAREFHEAEGVADWRVIGDGACTYFRTGSFEAGVRLVQAIGELPRLDDRSPDVDVRQDGVTVRLITITDDYY